MPDQKDKNAEQESKEGLHISRRDFLKDAGLVVGAPTLGSIAVTELATAQTKKSVPAEKPAGAAPVKITADMTTIELTVNGGNTGMR